MWGMYMSAELIATLSAFITLGIGMFAGFAWMIHRFDHRLESAETKLGTRIDAIENQLSTRIDAVEAQLANVKDEVIEVKIAVARIEGPPRHLMTAR